MTLDYFFKDMTLRQVWEGDVAPLRTACMRKKLIKSLLDTCMLLPRDFEKLHKFLKENDMLTRKLYNEYHYDSLYNHAAAVASNLERIRVNGEIAAMLAILHDIGKKYSSRDENEKACAAISAFIAARWLRGCEKIAEVHSKYLVSAIYYHTHPSTLWKGGHCQESLDELMDFFGGNGDAVATAKYFAELLHYCDEPIEIWPEPDTKKINEGKLIILTNGWEIG